MSSPSTNLFHGWSREKWMAYRFWQRKNPMGLDESPRQYVDRFDVIWATERLTGKQ